VALITVTARSKAWTVFGLSDTWIVGSNPTWAMDVCVHLFCVCAVLCAGSGLATGWPPSKESYRLCKKIKKLKSSQGPKKGCRAIDRYKGGGLRLIICACYSWETALNVILVATFYNMQGSKGIREEAREVSSTKAYTRNDETNSRRVWHKFLYWKQKIQF
jgi:hypothetical protein